MVHCLSVPSIDLCCGFAAECPAADVDYCRAVSSSASAARHAAAIVGSATLAADVRS